MAGARSVRHAIVAELEEGPRLVATAKDISADKVADRHADSHRAGNEISRLSPCSGPSARKETPHE